MANQTELSELAIAHHEAGHVAAQLYYKHSFDGVSIISNESSYGRVESILSERAIEILKHAAPDAEDERYLKQEAIILMAGGAAEAKFLKRKKFSVCCSSDIAGVTQICILGLGIHNKAIPAYIKYVKEEANNLFTNSSSKNGTSLWSFVKTLAELLIQKKRLTNIECERLYERIAQIHFVSGDNTIQSIDTINHKPEDWGKKNK